MDHDRFALAVHNRLPRWLCRSLVVSSTAVVAVFTVIPLANLLRATATRSSISAVLAIPGISRILWFTLWQAAVSTVATLAVAIVPSYVVGRYQFRGRSLLLAGSTLPFMMPTVVVGAALLAVMPQRLHNTSVAMIVGHAWINLAVAMRILVPSWRALSTDSTAAARTLGSTDRQVFRWVVLPSMHSALTAAALLTFAFSFTSFGIAKVMGGPRHPTWEVEIARRATQLGDVDGAAVMSIVQVILVGAVAVMLARLRRGQPAPAGRRPIRAVRSSRQRRLVYPTVAASAAIIAIPLTTLVVSSLRVGANWSLGGWRWGANVVDRPGVSLGVSPMDSILRSVGFAVLATVLATTVGTVAALAIATSRSDGRPWQGRTLEVGFLLPLAVSAVVTGFGFLVTFDQSPFDWRSRWFMTPLCHAMIGAPFVARAVLPSLTAQIGSGNRAAAATLGAAPITAWWWAQVAMLRHPIAGGAGLAAAISLGDFGASAVLSRTGSPTAPMAIASLLTRPGDLARVQGHSLAVVLMVLVVVAVLLADRSLGGADADR